MQTKLQIMCSHFISQNHDILAVVDEDSRVILLLLDLSTAFDAVDMISFLQNWQVSNVWNTRWGLYLVQILSTL